MHEVAHCGTCGWEGLVSELLGGPDMLDELCPSCRSPDTWWGPLEEK